MDRKFLIKNGLIQWENLLKDIFPISIPNNCLWEEKEDIALILNQLSKCSEVNHLFLPGGGGVDLVKAKKSSEENCIEFSSGGATYIINPKHLIFEGFNNNYKWSYFRIETNYLSPSNVYDDKAIQREELTEITPNLYVERSVWDAGCYQNNPLPETARIVFRYMMGSFVIFCKFSPYNLSSSKDAYSGYHNLMTASEFKEYIFECTQIPLPKMRKNADETYF